MPDPHLFTIEHLMQRMNIQIISYCGKEGHHEAFEFLRALQKEKPYIAR